MVLIAAVMVWGAEKDASHHTIKSLGDALWWAISTATTVGYGDRYPVSPEGKVIAAGLMILGIGVLGLVSAALASKLVETGTQSEHEELRQRMEPGIQAGCRSGEQWAPRRTGHEGSRVVPSRLVRIEAGPSQ